MDVWFPIQWVRLGDEEFIHVTIHRLIGDGGVRYAVRNDRSQCLNKKSKWVWEPQNSSRTKRFYKTCRFDSFDAAVKALERSERINTDEPVGEEMTATEGSQ
jgi:hypothetical protein